MPTLPALPDTMRVFERGWLSANNILFVDGDELTVLELNPRFGGAYPVSHLAGAGFPRKILAMLRGERVEPDLGQYEVGVRMMKDYAILPAYSGELADLRSRSPAR